MDDRRFDKRFTHENNDNLAVNVGRFGAKTAKRFRRVTEDSARNS